MAAGRLRSAVSAPTGRPLDELRGQAVRRPLESYALVIVDRFEELFTLCQEQSEREAFIEGLCRSAADGLPVVLGVRADFYGHCVAHPLFFAGNPGLQAGRECDPRPAGAKRRSSLRLWGDGQVGRFWLSM
ncbi:hypothetical protein G9272_44595 [Streptomyces asoensis]|uniref:Novel STAND NTPase 1 domain-containing protein n=1 Tax=Streptomyces asoensis TaxID=249586 RepID=A0A6M4X2J9_9ACTN|nr:hypothetical protein [Streptomyces asoensis]QJS98970.1 hypothetical protein G9272_00300 [Streptomyces asoensis]QJT06499.1 hypothetical protein G9272_44595 [Streptomyces asoensis]